MVDAKIHAFQDSLKDEVNSEYEKELETYNSVKQLSKGNQSTITNFIVKPDVIQLKLFPDNHPISMEEQIFFIKITEAIFGYNEQIRNDNLKVLSTDYNIKYLLPYLSTFIKDSIHVNLVFTDLTLLIYSVRMTKSLLANQHISLKEHLHEILPAILSCALSKKISKYYYDNHWTLRDFSAYVVANICQTYSNKTNNITNRVINIYLKALRENCKSLTTVYGCVKGLASLGEEIMQTYLFSNLVIIGRRLYAIFEKKVFSYYSEEKYKQQIIEAKHVKDVILNIIAPILLKNQNTNDGGLLYIKNFGYLGRALYVQVKNLERIDLDKQRAVTFGKTTLNNAYIYGYNNINLFKSTNGLNEIVQNYNVTNSIYEHVGTKAVEKI